MGFESGTVSFRVFSVPGGLPDDFLARFARHAAPPIDTLGKEAISGWVSGRHLLDRQLTEANAFLAGRLRLTLMKAERKIPPALLRAECDVEQIAVMQADGRDFLDSKTKSDIRKAIVDRLLPAMPPALTGIPFVYEEADRLLYAAATTDKQQDAFVFNFGATTGATPVPWTPETLALSRKGIDARQLDPASFSPECEDALAEPSLGMDFLTWLWFHSEERDGMIDGPHGDYAAILEGPLTFYREGHGAHVTTLQKGEPMLATEAKTALLGGKKLRRAKLTMSCEDETWQCTLNGEDFVFGGFKLPKTADFTVPGRFEERMLSLGRFRTGLLGFYDRFLTERTSRSEWPATQQAIHNWVTGRVAKA